MQGKVVGGRQQRAVLYCSPGQGVIKLSSLFYLTLPRDLPQGDLSCSHSFLHGAGGIVWRVLLLPHSHRRAPRVAPLQGHVASPSRAPPSPPDPLCMVAVPCAQPGCVLGTRCPLSFVSAGQGCTAAADVALSFPNKGPASAIPFIHCSAEANGTDPIQAETLKVPFLPPPPSCHIFFYLNPRL